MDKEEKIEYARYIIEEITSRFLKKDDPYLIQEGCEYIREVITLYAKQSNLLESTLVLLENNHAEEAYVLLRSMLNNSMLIEYLCHDNENRDRYNDYMIQPAKSQLSFLYDIRKAVQKGWMDSPPRLSEGIREHEQKLIDKGFKIERRGRTYADTKLLSIRQIALTDELLFASYIAFYKDGSKYEHSDFSSLDIYKQPFSTDVPTKEAFILDLSRTNVELETKVLNIAATLYSVTFANLLDHMLKTHKQLFSKEESSTLIQLAYFLAKNNHCFDSSNTRELSSEGVEQ
ncbi:DUF5677 domain-containing protein [Priestia megaterium]|uniref:DUF5677 domain-containing protein n=1 Tax=Priestia megaterium TaxID=1404 RepID=UPI002079C5AE|nr:DUF5677 domain-containing protein [Priestia megaterium]USL32937.1 DUF5677 domain-containing protein [Priestia megaterium]